MKQLFAIFITRQLTGNFKESILPYILANMKQIKIINKSKKDDLNTERDQELLRNIDQLQTYASAYVKKVTSESDSLKNSSLDENFDNNCDEISQPEVESIMPSVILIQNSINFRFKMIYIFIV